MPWTNQDKLTKDLSDRAKNKWMLIVDEWFQNGFIGYKAYQKYYPNANKNTASKECSLMFRNPWVANYIQQKREEQLLMNNISIERVMTELGGIAFGETDEKKVFMKDKLKALELLQKQFNVGKGKAATEDTIEVDVVEDEAEDS